MKRKVIFFIFLVIVPSYHTTYSLSLSDITVQCISCVGVCTFFGGVKEKTASYINAPTKTIKGIIVWDRTIDASMKIGFLLITLAFMQTFYTNKSQNLNNNTQSNNHLFWQFGIQYLMSYPVEVIMSNICSRISDSTNKQIRKAFGKYNYIFIDYFAKETVCYLMSLPVHYIVEAIFPVESE